MNEKGTIGKTHLRCEKDLKNVFLICCVVGHAVAIAQLSRLSLRQG